MTRSAAAVLEWPAAPSSVVTGTMGETKDDHKGKPQKPGEEGNGVDHAFDLWLQRGLHQLYDTVAQEPLPPELLRLIEEDRNNRQGGK